MPSLPESVERQPRRAPPPPERERERQKKKQHHCSPPIINEHKESKVESPAYSKLA